MKVKTFSFEGKSIFEYNRNWEEEENYRKANGEYRYIRNIDLIDRTINDFISDEQIEIIDIKINEIVVGNNPPTSILIYTIMYKEV